MARQPGNIIDPLLWRDAQHILARHNRPNDHKCSFCGQPWPCEPRRLAERAAEVARPQRKKRSTPAQASAATTSAAT